MFFSHSEKGAKTELPKGGVDMQSAHAGACFVRVGSCRPGSVLGSILGAFWEPKSPLYYLLGSQSHYYTPLLSVVIDHEFREEFDSTRPNLSRTLPNLSTKLPPPEMEKGNPLWRLTTRRSAKGKAFK